MPGTYGDANVNTRVKNERSEDRKRCGEIVQGMWRRQLRKRVLEGRAIERRKEKEKEKERERETRRKRRRQRGRENMSERREKERERCETREKEKKRVEIE